MKKRSNRVIGISLYHLIRHEYKHLKYKFDPLRYIFENDTVLCLYTTDDAGYGFKYSDLFSEYLKWKILNE